jgi:uncharacterized protein YjdB
MRKSIVKTVNKSISRFFGRLAKTFGGEEVQEVVLPQSEPQQEIEQESAPKLEVEEKQQIAESKKQNKKKSKERRFKKIK